jgi:diaminopimelate epimerase
VNQRLRTTLMSGAGNRFVVVDGLRDPLPSDPVPIALALARRADLDVDGLLLLEPPTGAASGAMVLYNLDGTRAEACGNGLRCIAKLLVDHGHVDADEMRIETDSGPRVTRVIRDEDRVVAAVAELGVPTVHALSTEVELADRVLEVTLVDLGNPHCVLFVDDLDLVDVDELGPILEEHPDLPGRHNVEFVVADHDGVSARVWERGVGETESCGTGAAAAAVAALLTDRTGAPVTVSMPGGELIVDWDGVGSATLEGPVETLDGDRHLPPEEGIWRSS